MGKMPSPNSLQNTIFHVKLWDSTGATSVTFSAQDAAMYIS